MSDNKEWDELNQAMNDMESDEKETPLPSIEEQKVIVEKLKKLEAEGKLTPEILEEHFGQFNNDKTPPVH